MFALLESKEHWKYASGNQPVDMEWNKAEKCWQPMVFDDHDDDDDDDYLANNSGAETAASASAIEDNSAADVRRCVRRCGNCPGCRSKQDCGRCKMCKYKKEFGGPGSRGACIHRPCTGAKQRQQGARSSSTGGRKRPPAAAKAADHDDVPDPTVIPQNGDRVYCRWPENNEWYWGRVVKKYEHRYGHTLYTVLFDDGDKRTRVPVKDMIVEAEDYLLHPVDKKLKESPKDAVSLSSASTSSMATRQSTASSSDTPFQINVPPRGATTNNRRHQQQPPPPPRDVAGRGAPHTFTPTATVAAGLLHHHRGGDSLPHRGGKEKSSTFESTLDVGSRVWARFSGNKRYYWGNITEKSGEGNFTTYSVLFDDGDMEDNIPREYVHAETQDLGHTKFKTTADICRKCAMCLKDDCGSCRACDSNRQSTQASKYCCLFKSCMALNIDQKAQSIPGLPPDWRFYFDHEPSSLSTTKSTPLHPKLAGLRIIPPPLDTKKIYGSLEAAVKKNVLSETIAMNAAEQLYEKWLGLQIRVPVDAHELIGKRYCRQWLDVTGKPKALFGHIISCVRYYFAWEHLSFEVEYDEECRLLVDAARGFDAPVMKIEEVTEALAWGGYVLCQEKASFCGGIMPLQLLPAAENPPPHIKWLLPDMIHRDLLPPGVASNGRQRPRLSIIFRGFRLVLEARQSGIPNAGLGVFLTCFATSAFMHNLPQEFVLPAGELLDIGLYAPLRKEDLKTGGVLVLKNFIHNWASEVYGFDITGPDKGKKIFDITDDLTSELHEEASQSVPAFVNETDGNATPTIHAMHDPHGSVHYLLGHNHSTFGPFRIPLGKEIEVEIDYGPSYERVRVRKQYSRLNDLERLKVEDSIRLDDSETLSDINEWSVLEVDESIVFLTNLKFTQPSLAAGRSLIAATLLLHRLFEVQKEIGKMSQADLAAASYCDNGYSTMGDKKIVKRAINVVLQLLGLYDNEDKMLEDFFRSNEVFVYYLAKAVETPAMTAKKLNGGTIRKKIQALCKTH